MSCGCTVLLGAVEATKPLFYPKGLFLARCFPGPLPSYPQLPRHCNRLAANAIGGLLQALHDRAKSPFPFSYWCFILAGLENPPPQIPRLKSLLLRQSAWFFYMSVAAFVPPAFFVTFLFEPLPPAPVRFTPPFPDCPLVVLNFVSLAGWGIRS